MKLYVLNNGYLEADKNMLVAGSVIGTLSNPHIENQWVRLPVLCFLIQDGDDYILFDAGCHPDGMNGYWHEGFYEAFPYYYADSERLENQLALCGVKPEDIKTVVLSHMHGDHAGNMHLFPHATVYVPKADFYHGQATVHANPDRNTHGGYIKGDLERPAQYQLVEEDFELRPGVEVINLPGHTPGLLGMVVHTDGGTYILPQDCVYCAESYGPPAKAIGIVYDSLAYFKSIEKVHKLEKKYNAKVIFSHDWEQAQTLKYAPECYE